MGDKCTIHVISTGVSPPQAFALFVISTGVNPPQAFALFVISTGVSQPQAGERSGEIWY